MVERRAPAVVAQRRGTADALLFLGHEIVWEQAQNVFSA